MNDESERKALIKKDQEFSTLPRPNYEKMTNDQIRKRTEIMEQTFKVLFSETDDEEDDNYL
ncbi:hypothetical protein SAMN05421839_1026 [Halolactibacillus halophilus]|uniref:Uncharacterized protein n=1 Tax=Halolactibacillus halophilus TaxID=306540 RepID=A0A1I5LE88_9BACI|nr:hypothetical protein [Halolactibacillus halophilus]GEM00886.1 hypothetical protein HHA03_04180 [Halolactibacillus halophilus]SFO95031.1 hypothetical protein SAMN05421839_1026 [Halolactibacillus halophilus]